MAPSPENGEDELQPEYDLKSLRGGVRGKYAARYAAGTNLVRLDPEVAAAFKSEASVNEALRLFLRMMREGEVITRGSV